MMAPFSERKLFFAQSHLPVVGWPDAKPDWCAADRLSLPGLGLVSMAGAEKRKPDLHSSGQLPKGRQRVLLTLTIHEDAVLLSDFDLWHYVLNADFAVVSMNAP